MLRCLVTSSTIEHIAAYYKYLSFLRICAPCQRAFYEAVQILTFYEFINFLWHVFADREQRRNLLGNQRYFDKTMQAAVKNRLLNRFQ